MLLRLTYLTVTNVFNTLRLLPASDHDKNVEILAPRHQITVLQRQLDPKRPQFTPADRHSLPRSSDLSPKRRYAACDCSYVPTPSCDGTATCSNSATRTPLDLAAQAGPGPCAPSAC